MRNTGEHDLLKKSMDKRYTLDGLHDQKNLMMTAAFGDKLKRDLLIIPTGAKFGNLKVGSVYRLVIRLKNEDPLAQRITVKPAECPCISITQNPFGPIAMGMTKEIVVEFTARSEIMGQFDDQFEIVSKHDIYKIPVTANIMEPAAWIKLDADSRVMNKKSILKANVKDISENMSPRQHSEYMESGLSDSQFPKLTYDKNTKLEVITNAPRLRHNNDSYVSESGSQQ